MTRSRWKQKFYSVLLSGILAVSSASTLVPMPVYAEKGEGTVYAARSFDQSYDSENAYDGDDLGCNYTPERTTFKVWSPLASSVVLCRYEKGNGGKVIGEIPMDKGSKGVWSTTVEGNIVNTYYTYKVTVNGTTREAVDIYAKAAGVNGDRAMVVDLDSTDPDNWDTDYKREKTLLSDIIVWEVHIRDFSIDASSGVSQENRGKYKAFTENTTVNREGMIPSCVNYLKELGVTHVQLLPMYDYASVDETTVSTSPGTNYNWGYDPKNYNVPEGSYSSNPYDGNVRITEMKEMIQALHDAGIKVIMDVVYNHTYDTADSNFNKIMPDYYYKLNNDLSYNNQSGCGNATRSESAMYRKFMIDSVSYWAGEYNLDGFRFDLMGIHDYTTMNKLRQTLDEKYGEDTIVLYGEGWTASDYDANSAHKANEAKLDDGIGYFNDQIRDAIKGEHKFDKTIGLVQTNYFSGTYLEEGQKWPNNVFGGIMGSVGHTDGEWGMWRPFWSKSSNCSLSYTSAHDNLTLWDKLTEGYGKDFNSTRQELLNMNKMAGSVILTSKGGVFMQAGEEFARTKNGDDNSYSSPDSVNKIDWTRVGTYSAIQKYYQGMIQIRKAFSGFRSITTRSSNNWEPNNNNLTWIGGEAGRSPYGLFGFYETNNTQGEWNRVAVLVNNAITAQSTTLTGSDKWVVIADGTSAGLDSLYETGTNVTVPAKSVIVAVPKDTFDANSNKAPVISAPDTYDLTTSDELTFVVDVSDPDGDSLTITASGVPDGAAFDAVTKTFRWSNPVTGTYKVVFTANDGKTSATRTVTIKVTEKTAALKALLAEAEGKNYHQSDFTDAVWTPYAKAAADARQFLADNRNDDTELHSIYEALQNTYQNVKTQAGAKDALQDLLTDASARLVAAKNTPADYEEEAVTDLSTVIDEAAELLKAPHPAEDYTSEAEDLEDALKACVNKNSKQTVRVKAANWANPSIYIWNESGFIKTWPGTKLTTKDDEGWYIYEFPEEYPAYSVIINDGSADNASQTSDITGLTGSVDITVTSFSGKSCNYTKEVHPSVQIQIDKTRLVSWLSKAEQALAEKEDASLAEQIRLGKLVNQDSNAAQVQINQAVRALKQTLRNANETEDPPVVVKASLTKAQIIVDDSQCKYDGSNQEPLVSVLYESKPLVKGQDYTIEFDHNQNAADKDAETAPTIVITGIGEYTDTQTAYFTIQKADLPAQAPADRTVDKSIQKVSDILLQGNWQWDTDSHELAISFGDTVNATALYTGADKDNYKVISVNVSISKADCTHPSDKIEIKNAVSANCTEKGYTGDQYCTECNQVIESGSDLPILSHTWDDGIVIRNATATETGLIEYTCLECHTKKQSIIDALGTQEDDNTNPGGNGSEGGNSNPGGNGSEGGSSNPGGSGSESGNSNPGGNGSEGGSSNPGGSGSESGNSNPGGSSNPGGTSNPGGSGSEGGTSNPGGSGSEGSTSNPGGNGSVGGSSNPGGSSSGAADAGKADSGKSDTMDIKEAVMQTAVTITTNAKVVKGTSVTDPVSKTTYRITGAKAAEYAYHSNSVSQIRIPDTITVNGITYKVTAVAANAFKYKAVEKVILGANIKNIGKRAFYGCSALKTITLSGNLTTIGESAFGKCTALTRIKIPSKVNKIGKQAFYGCKKLSSITIKTTKLTTKKVGSNAWKGIASKAVIKVPKTKLSAYKKLLKAKGVGAKATIKK